MSDVTIDGIKYVVVGLRGFVHKDVMRQSLILRRPAGKVSYYAVRYENGNFSKPFSCSHLSSVVQ